MTTKRILLVEDHAAYKKQFDDAFNADVDVFHTAEDFIASGLSGWEYAFVDFGLEHGRKTGFSVLLHLRETSADTKVVLFNDAGDSGRMLFNIAAFRWFGVWGMMGKGASADEKALARVGRGVVPTPEPWRRRIHEHGYLIDLLFKQPNWVDIWPVWRQYLGSADAVLRARPDFKPHQLRAFREGTSHAVELIESTLLTRLTEQPAPRDPRRRPSLLAAPTGGYQPENATRGVHQALTVGFAGQNCFFFDAPDLRDAVNAAMPWKR